MASSEKWTCDGIPKNGQEYPDCGGAHGPYENDLTTCDFCDLPKEAMIQPGKKKLPLKVILVALVGIVTVAGGGAAYTFIAQNCKAGLEKINGECIDPFLQPYQEAKKQGDEAINIAESYQSIEDLEKAQSTLSNVLVQLSQIPSEALVYPEVATTLQGYQTKNTEIDSNLAQEKLALEQFDEAEKIAQVAKLATDGDRNTAQLTEAKQKWQEAINKLNEIDSTSLLTIQIAKYTSDYDKQIAGISDRIAAMNKPKITAPAPRVSSPPVRIKNQPPIRKQRPNPPRKKVNSTPKKNTPVDICGGNNNSPGCVF